MTVHHTPESNRGQQPARVNPTRCQPTVRPVVNVGLTRAERRQQIGNYRVRGSAVAGKPEYRAR